MLAIITLSIVILQTFRTCQHLKLFFANGMVEYLKNKDKKMDH